MKTPGENVNVFVVQRLPLLRIIADNWRRLLRGQQGISHGSSWIRSGLACGDWSGDQYFCQKKPASFRNVAQSRRVLEQSGDANPSTANQDIDLVLRVGNALVHLGKAENFDQKLNNLRAFYEKVLPNVGWNRYQAISVAYENQVIGIKQEP